MHIQKTISALTIAVTTAFSFSVDRAEAHGKPHPGNHPKAYGANCLERIYDGRNLGLGYWKNNCSIGVEVVWRDKSEDGPCGSRSYSRFPCSWYVSANSRRTAMVEGNIEWMACKAETFTSGPHPSLLPNGRYNCKHLGFRDHKKKDWKLTRYSNGDHYIGSYRNGKRHGTGLYRWNSGNSYVGQWRNGDFHGLGTRMYSDGDVYTGQWRNDERLGLTAMERARERELAREYEEEQEWERELERNKRRRNRPNAWDTINNTLKQQRDAYLEAIRRRGSRGSSNPNCNAGPGLDC